MKRSPISFLAYEHTPAPESTVGKTIYSLPHCPTQPITIDWLINVIIIDHIDLAPKLLPQFSLILDTQNMHITEGII